MAQVRVAKCGPGIDPCDLTLPGRVNKWRSTNAVAGFSTGPWGGDLHVVSFQKRPSGMGGFAGGACSVKQRLFRGCAQHAQVSDICVQCLNRTGDSFGKKLMLQGIAAVCAVQGAQVDLLVSLKPDTGAAGIQAPAADKQDLPDFVNNPEALPDLQIGPVTGLILQIKGGAIDDAQPDQWRAARLRNHDAGARGCMRHVVETPQQSKGKVIAPDQYLGRADRPDRAQGDPGERPFAGPIAGLVHLVWFAQHSKDVLCVLIKAPRRAVALYDRQTQRQKRAKCCRA